jgi:hypothetical protein
MHALKQQGDPGLKELWSFEESILQLDKLAIAKRAQRVSFHVAHSVTRDFNFELKSQKVGYSHVILIHFHHITIRPLNLLSIRHHSDGLLVTIPPLNTF